MRVVYVPLLATAILLACSAPTSQTIAQSESALTLTVHESAHYLLGTDTDEATAKEYSKVLEACWPLFEKFFGDTPELRKGEKLNVFFLETQEAWGTKLKEDGVGIPFGAGGYYYPGTKGVYLWRQPTLYNTRQLLIHEAMHQFHYLACCNNVNPKDNWYIEGIVEYLSRHYWDGEKLTLGVIPACSLANYAELALGLFEREDYDLGAMINGDRASARPEQWALVRYLMLADDGKHLKGWNKLRKRLDSGQSAKNVFRKTIGNPKALQPKIREWLKTQQEPLVPVWNEWQGLGPDAVVGISTVTSGCRVREDATKLSATLHVPEGAWKGGLLIGFADSDSYTVALLNSAGRFSINESVEGGWNVHKRGDAPAAIDGTYKLAAVRANGRITVTANDVELGSFALSGHKLGVCLENCTLRFTDMKWE